MSLARELLESDSVDLMPIGDELVSIAPRSEELVSPLDGTVWLEDSTQPGDVGTKGPLGRPWQILPPKLVDEVVRRDDAIGVRDQVGEDRAFFGAGDLHGSTAVVHDLEGTENEEAHRRQGRPGSPATLDGLQRSPLRQLHTPVDTVRPTPTT